MKSKTLIIGDIHGCSAEFEQLLQKAKFRAGVDRLILVGDLINKGPDSLGVLRKAQELSAIVLMGNHEYFFLQYLKNNRTPKKDSFEEVIAQLGSELEKWRAWIEKLPLYYEEKDFLVVHGGLPPHQHPKDVDATTLTTIRTWDGKGEDLNNPNDPAWFECYTQKKLIVFGHWASRGLVERENAIGLDTGCVYGGSLSALLLPKREIIQVKAQKTYRPVNHF